MNNLDIELCKTVLEEFLNFPLDNSMDVMKKFASLPNAISCFDNGKRNYVFVSGSRKDRVVLAAHADTVWDNYYTLDNFIQKICCNNGKYYGKNTECGIGADDRAGCAILWLLKDLGHSLLILDGEEHGQVGANYIKETNPELFTLINEHNYIVQFDRRGSSDYKTYSLPVTKEFICYIEENTGYHDAGKNARTDIVALCDKVCGVNLSVGYYDEHTPNESLKFGEWYHTLEIAKNLLVKLQPKFPLSK